MFSTPADTSTRVLIQQRIRKLSAALPLKLLAVMLLLTCVVAVGTLASWIGSTAHASNPASATLGPTSTQVTWVGTAPGGSTPNAPLVLGSETACVEGVNCETFTLTLSGTPANWAAAQKAVHVHLGWLLPLTDYDLYIHKGDLSGDVVASSGRGITSPTGPLTSEDADLDPSNPGIGTGPFAVHVVYYNATGADPYTGVASVFDQAPPPPPTPPTPISSETAPGFTNYADPNGHDWGEPSLGVNFKTNNAMFVSALTTYRISFDDNQSPAKATWTDKSFLTTSLVTWDPILFTDSQTGRTFVSQLQFPSKQSTTAFTDDDGDNWLPSQGSAINAGVDHQSIGGGPLHAPLTMDPKGAVYPNGVYYAAQDLVTAEIGLSTDGGGTFGPAVPMYTTECVGIHGHIKVAPDGTIYVPNRSCGGQQAMWVSKDNGVTWQMKAVPGSHSATWDPSVGIGADGTVYFGYGDSNRTPRLAVYDPNADKWLSDYPVGGATVFSGVAFPAVVAGDGDRAAFAFLGTTSAGIPFGSGTSFTGAWHLYIATTFDRGASYTLSDATPNDPVQRGNICDQGAGCPSSPKNTRNLLDFMDAQIDNKGRVLVGYADGCITAACIAGQDVSSKAGPPDGRVDSYDNDGRAVGTIARQSSGKTLFKAFDSGAPTPTPTPAPTPPPSENPCFAPGVTIVTDPGGDQINGTGAAESQLDVQSLKMAEPFTTNTDNSVTFTMKVANLASPLPPNATWFIRFNVNDTTNTSRPLFVEMNTNGSDPTTPQFGIGRTDTIQGNSLDTTQTTLSPQLISGSFTADGTITIKVKTQTDMAMTATGAPNFTVNLGPGKVLSVIKISTSQLVGAAGSGLNLTTDASANNNPVSGGTYTLMGNIACSGPTSTPTPTPTPIGTPTPTPTPTPADNCSSPTFSLHMSPTGFGDSWGEPSIGVNWKTEQVFNGTPNGGTVMSFGGFGDGSFPDVTGLRITFDDTNPAAPKATWEHTASMAVTGAPRAAGDPILFTDHETGRTFFTQLLGLTPLGSTTEFTDDDGRTFTPSEGSGLPSGVDHETFGGGPFAAPLTGGAGVYKNAVYYCSQSVADATCSISVDGGTTFGPGVPIYTVADCSGLHGHIKVGPDGTAYIPNKGCGGSLPYHDNSQQAVIVSTNNGATWTIRPVTTSTGNGTDTKSDPSVAVATDGTLYFAYQANDGHAHVSVSRDQGQTWINDSDVGAQLGIQNSVFPAVVAGDPDRAAFAFFGTTTGGTDFDQPTFAGVWYLFIATTYNGGQTWTTVNATPGDPIQRGGICGSGTCRNLLDFFDATIDKEGRALVVYDDGCISAGCIAGTSGNDFTAKGAIARQLTGKRMFAAFDPSCGNPTPTPTPTPTSTPTPTPTPTPAPTPTGLLPAPADSGPKVGYQNFEAPGTLVNVTSTSQGPGANTVEYLGHDAGEPSIGNNWKSGLTSYQSDLQTLFITFNDSCPSGSPATWVNRPAPTSQFVDSDPIGFTDRYTGRTFAGELTLTSPSCKTSFTDDDGQTWVASQGSGLGASVDHETIGGGPFHAPLTRPTNVPGLYPDAVYYCSQLPHAACARSDDGGASFGPIVEVDPVADAHCGGLHGHLKVAPDGTVYLPFSYCDSQGATIVSEDNGITWTIRHVPNTVSSNASTANIQDPAVGVDNNGRAYFVMASGIDKNITNAVVATTDDHGATWQNVYDVGAAYGLKNIAYPAAVAADPGRAAVAFYGTTTAGDEAANGFKGIWHLYVAETFDGGAHWSINDVTPNAPTQRGCIWMHGGVNICRNLLDFFDMTVDSQGRVEVGYVNGCAGGNCAQSSASANGNAYTATATIARQSSGRRLVATFDPPNAMAATSAPGMPSVTTRRIGNVVHLGWSEADNGNSAITSYKIMSGTAAGAETLLTTVPGSQTLYDDAAATDTSKTYYYKVLAVNAVGTSCGANEVAAPYVGDTCSGLIVQRNDPSHPESLIAAQNPSLAIDYVAVGEPSGTNNFMFKLKVSSLASVPANSRWRVVWNTEASSGQQFYVGMTTGTSGAPTFDYGIVATGAIPPVIGLIGVPQETSLGAALAASNFNGDGTITIYVPKSAVGNPQPGDLLGAVNGRTFTGDTPGTFNLERSTLLIDHTFVKAQRDNGSPAATYTVAGNNNCSPFIEQIINSLVSLQASNPSSTTGKGAFDLAIKNTSAQSIFTPLQAEVAQLSSTSGKVTVANADNSQGGTGALWSYSTYIGSDNTLSPNEVSTVRNLKFNNPNNETFTVTFNVVGTIAQASSSSSSSGGTAGSGGSGSSSPSSNTGGVTAPLGTITNMVFQVTYNSVLKTVTVKLK